MHKTITLGALLIGLLLSACQTTPPAEAFTDFWPKFQKAVGERNKVAVADLTHFPLTGAEPYTQTYNLEGIDQIAFLSAYDKIFDLDCRKAIVTTQIEELDSFVSEDDPVTGLTAGTQVYALTVLYTYDGGEESSVSFHFAQKEGKWQLRYLILAG